MSNTNFKKEEMSNVEAVSKFQNQSSFPFPLSKEYLDPYGFEIVQPESGFRFGTDAILLANFTAKWAKYRSNHGKALELGSGCGVVSFLLLGQRPDFQIDAVEINPHMAQILKHNIMYNRLEKELKMWNLDCTVLLENTKTEKNASQTEETLLKNQKNSYDLVFFNPPFQSVSQGPITGGNTQWEDLTIKDQLLRQSRFEITGSVENFIEVASQMLSFNGQLMLIHRASRLAEIISFCLKWNMGMNMIQLVHPKLGDEAKLVLVCAQKNRKAGGFKVLPPIFLQNDILVETREE